MSSASALNRELGKLDTALRSGRIDRDRFRAERRRLLLDFEERQTTTTPGADNSAVTIPGAVAAAAPSAPAASPSVSVPPREPAVSAPAARGGRKGLIAMLLGAVVVSALIVGWMMRTGSESPVPAVALPESTSVTDADAELPQGVATALMQSQWTQADLADFLLRWQRLPADAVRATANDPKIWLLRGEIDRRLRESREAQSVAPSTESLQRVQQLEDIQAAIRAP